MFGAAEEDKQRTADPHPCQIADIADSVTLGHDLIDI